MISSIAKKRGPAPNIKPDFKADLFVVREEGGKYEQIDWREFDRIMHGDEKPCAVGIAFDWYHNKPIGWIYDFIVAKKTPQANPWEQLKLRP